MKLPRQLRWHSVRRLLDRRRWRSVLSSPIWQGVGVGLGLISLTLTVLLVIRTEELADNQRRSDAMAHSGRLSVETIYGPIDRRAGSNPPPESWRMLFRIVNTGPGTISALHLDYRNLELGRLQSVANANTGYMGLTDAAGVVRVADIHFDDTQQTVRAECTDFAPGQSLQLYLTF